MNLEQLLAHHEAECTSYDAGWIHGCYCGWRVNETENTPEVHWANYHAHVADQIREWLLSDQTIDDAAEILFAHEFGNYSPDAHPDHNRWTWRGDGHTEEFKDGYRNVTRQALTAALDQGNQT